MKSGSVAPVIAIVCPDSVLVDAAGSMHVLRCQIAAVRRFGADPVLYVAAPSVRPGGRISAGKRAAIERGAAELGVSLAAILSTRITPSSLPAWLMTLSRVMTRRGFGPDADVDLAAITAPPTAGTAVQPMAVIANYLPAIPIADALVPPDQQIIILHDMPESDRSRRFLARLAGRPALMALNESDAEWLRARLPGVRVHSGLQIQPGLIGKPARLARAPHTAAAALAACGAAHAAGEHPWSARRDIDLLFVGGAHRPNINGLRRFLSDCFLPRLAPKGITLAVAGKAGDALSRHCRQPAEHRRSRRLRQACAALCGSPAGYRAPARWDRHVLQDA